MVLDLLRYVRGYVDFTVSGKYPERFINITSRNGVRLWNVKRRDDSFTACMYRADYLKIRTLARKAGVKLRVHKKNGLPALLVRYRDRTGILIGFGAYLLSVFVMSMFIWSVDITGLETLSETDMTAVLREHGLYVGAFKPGLDYRRIARDIMLERHEVGWMAVNVAGSYASVEIKEESPAPAVEDVSYPCNVKAACDGQILRIEAFEGQTILKEGSGVIEGQLIVSGVKGDELTGYRLVHADAQVIARTKREASFSMPRKTVSLRPDGEVAERKSFLLFGMRLPYLFGAVHSPYSTEQVRTDSPAPLGITLPVGVMTEQVTALESVETEFDEAFAKELLMREAHLYEGFSLPDCTVEDREYRWSCESGVFTLAVTYTCVEDIAYTEPIGTDEYTDQTRETAPAKGEE